MALSKANLLRLFLLVLAASVAALTISNAARLAAGTLPECSCDKTKVVAEALPFIDSENNSFVFPYYSNVGSVLDSHPNIRHAIILCHGASRVANSYFCAGQGALCTAQKLGIVPEGTSAVFATHFVFPEDKKPERSLIWTNKDKDGVWRFGEDTQGGDSGVGVSSYDVMDRFLAILSDQSIYPNLERITVAGHSSGGQLVNRYALVRNHGEQTETETPRIRFVVANPSSYPYLNASRWVPDASHLAVPSTDECPNYNTWYFGLHLEDSTPRYIKTTDMHASVERFQHLDVVYLLGKLDSCNPNLTPGCDSHGLETTCSDMLQGQQRLQRGIRYGEFLNAFYGKPTHRTVFVPGVEHQHFEMFTSAEGVEVLFG